MCIGKVLVDRLGRIHFAACENNNTGFSKELYSYDGVQVYPSGFKTRHNYLHLSIVGIDTMGRFYGFYDYLKEDGSGVGQVVFNYDPTTRATEYYGLSDITDGGIQEVAAAEGALFVLVYHEAAQACEILRISRGAITSLLQFEVGSGPKYEYMRLAVTENDFWAVIYSGFIYRISRKNGAVHHYSLPGHEKQFRPALVSSLNEVWLTTNWIKPDWNSVYLWDAQTDSFIRNPHKPPAWKDGEIVTAKAFKDAQGNILVEYWDENGVPSATLVDSRRRLSDFTAVISEHQLISGSDFKQGLIFHDPGLRFVEVASRMAVKKNTDTRGARGLVELDAQTLYLNKKGVLSYDNGAWEFQNSIIPCLGRANFDSDVAMDSNGYIWFATAGQSEERYLMRYHSGREACDTFSLGLDLERFAFMENGQMALATKDNVYLWDPQSDLPRLLTKQPFQGMPNQIFEGRDESIWVATESGLLKIAPRTGAQKWINLLDGQSISVKRIHEDSRGRLWLGTQLNGLLIYDPASGSVQVINQAKGLSNNTVVSLLEDKDGDIWAGTFYGITLLSPEGMVIGKLYEADGLANNECNRWSALKMRDGRLCFGSVGGLTVIDPELWKAPREAYRPPQIFLTELYSNAKGQSYNTINHLPAFRQRERIILPADNRNLQAVFVLSNYASPEKSLFAYQIEGEGREWHYMGAQRQLSLNALAAGSYNILIRGTDGRGKWSEPPIVIPVTVKAFFYQQWWFFVLCALPFLAFFILWQYRQRGERQRLEYEVQNRTAIIREQADKLRELDHAKTRLYTNITHEFRTPLTVIMGMARQIGEMPPANEIKKGVEVVLRNSGNLLNLVNQMLGLSKLESGAMPLHLAQDDLARFLLYIAESFRSVAHTRSIRFRFLTDEEKLFMDFDAEKVRQVVANLLSNAMKFTPEGGEVYLHLDKMGDESAPFAIIKVQDTGIGISTEKLPYIFDRFYQVDDSSTRRGEGTGIGLTLTAELVSFMGGKLSVASEPGQGSTFTVKLPVRNEAPLASDILPVVPESMILSWNETAGSLVPGLATDTGQHQAEKPSVLIVEDNADVVNYLALCLKGQYELQVAMNGQEGIDTAIETVPDLIVSDVMMPIRDGFELCQTLKLDERTSHIPIVLLTAKADAESRLAGLRRGADAYLSKPFNKEELLVRLEQLVALRRKLQLRYQSLSPLEPAEEENLQIEDAFVQKLRTVVLDNLDNEKLDMSLLCQALRLSRSQLHRKVKALTEQSPIALVWNIRLHKSKELLSDSNLTIAQVAYSVGFGYPENYSRAFQDAFGLPPARWREEQRG
ncbi:MAG: response regulator [Phaeodactylibacter sp.]|nr:response regulator [Phaeodactylibacter sp.]